MGDPCRICAPHRDYWAAPVSEAAITPLVAKAVFLMSCFQPVHPAILAIGSMLSGWFPMTNVDVSDTTPPVTL